MDFQRAHVEGLREITLHNKEKVLARLLRAFAERGKDLASLTAEDCAAYREYLRDLAARGVYSLDTCSHLVRSWNSTMRASLGETGKPGEGLLMRTFPQRARSAEHLNERDLGRLLEAADRFAFRWVHTREAFKTYLELAWSTGARVGSLFEGRLRVGDIDWDRQVLAFRHMKNREHHTAVLTARAAVALKRWCDRLRTCEFWSGAETPLFVDVRGRPLQIQWLNKSLKGVAALAGLTKPVTSHVIRKSVGTLIGRENPKLAQLQLGISAEVFNEHYNQPLLEDRLARRDILPGSRWTPRTPEEIAGRALLELTNGERSREEFDRDLAEAKRRRAQPEIHLREAYAGYQ